ncbi:unnamed protein product [Caenorhabditis angaria]|uniref:Serpentine receptor class r-10 n=1 Tax=Caenorhabditis angaria TaxID=860376 RepID=A0A9P1J203_9PELO|nr:unnamed protein product [Caenorhabditis angaria]
MTWKLFVSRLQEIAAIISLSAHFLLILLVLTKSPKKIGSYKYLMIYISIFEILYSINDVLIEPICFSYGSKSIFVVVVNTENAYFNKDICLILISTWGAFFGSFMGLFVLQFFYRYCVASGSSLIKKSFQSWRIVLWMSGPVFCGILWGLLTYFLLPPDEQIDEAIRDVLLVKFNWTIEQITYVGPYFHRNSENIHIPNAIGFLIMVMIMIASLLLITIFAIKCYQKMDDFTSLTSNRTKSLQFQLFYALVTQTLIPLILMHLPVLIFFIFTFSNIGLGNASSIVSMTVALFPALDPFPVMFIIKNYRNAIFDTLTKIFKRKP